MADMEKVIGHLNDCLMASKRSNGWVFVRKDIVEDALELLKEQQKQIEQMNYIYGYIYGGQVKEIKELVRCKDCKHGRLYDVDLIDCELNELAKDANFFCADGERKEGR